MKKVIFLICLTWMTFACSNPKKENSIKVETAGIESVDTALSKVPVLFQGKVNPQAGTTYVISNQTNVLIQYMYGVCGPTTSGDIYPSQPFTIFVANGDRLTMTFVARYSAPRCGHCFTKELTGDASSSSQSINLREETFCF